MQLRILYFLAGQQDWTTRQEIAKDTGDTQGFSKALGAPTNPPMKSDALEDHGFVERRDETPPFAYKITSSGKLALSAYAAENPEGWAQLCADVNFRLPEEIDYSTKLLEGTVSKIMVNAYERNPKARRRCIAHYGPTCIVCGITFGDIYGPLAEGFIHVHHIKPLAEIGEEYEVNLITDLRPVCPNCHAVIHLGGGCRDLEDVRNLLAQPMPPN